MTTKQEIPHAVHLVGSMTLPSVDAVFENTGNILGRRLKRVPDGEPGGRNLWISWQYPLLRANPFLQAQSDPNQASSAGLAKLELGAGVVPKDVKFGELGYSREARASYIDFCRARDNGLISSKCRFQVCLPTPIAVVLPFVTDDAFAAVEPAYEAAMLRELDKICTEIPSADLAIQWDVCIEMVMWDGRYDRYRSRFEDAKGEIIGRLSRLGDAVPLEVELGFHLCYGDWEAKHFIEPEDTGAMVELANAIAAATQHSIAFVHMPVPIERSDSDFFAPLANLQLDRDSELFLGVVHPEDGTDGTQKRIKAAQEFIQDFGISTECGLGRCKKPDDVLNILRLHASASGEPMEVS